MCKHLPAPTPGSQGVFDVFRFGRSLSHLPILQACFTYRCVAILPAPLDGIVERQKGVKMKATMLIERDRRAIRCEYMQVDCFHHLHIQSETITQFCNLTSKASEVRCDIRFSRRRLAIPCLRNSSHTPRLRMYATCNNKRCQISPDSRRLERL